MVFNMSIWGRAVKVDEEIFQQYRPTIYVIYSCEIIKVSINPPSNFPANHLGITLTFVKRAYISCPS